MSFTKNRIVAVGTGAVIVMALGATGATAAQLITSADIKNETITTSDVMNGSLTGADLATGGITGTDLKDGSVVLNDLSPGTQSILRPKTGTTGVKVDVLAGDKTITNIGGPINANHTDLETGVTLPAGTYLVTVDGDFEANTAAADPSVDVYPQLSLWLDLDDSGTFTWQNGEGSISPNALMPDAANRHISTSGSTVIELTTSTYVGLVAFGYDSAQGTARSGEIDVIKATVTATPLR